MLPVQVDRMALDSGTAEQRATDTFTDVASRLAKVQARLDTKTSEVESLSSELDAARKDVHRLKTTLADREAAHAARVEQMTSEVTSLSAKLTQVILHDCVRRCQRFVHRVLCRQRAT